MNLRLTLCSIVTLMAFTLSAQLISTDPIFPTPDGPVTVIFDASQGNAALAGYTGDVYAHTGLITQDSDTPSDWQYVQGVWGTADPEVLMTSLGDDKYSITFSSIMDFYGAAADDTIYQMAFVFRNAAGTIVGRDVDGSDIFVNVYAPGLNVAITVPDYNPYLVNPGDNVHIEASSTYSDSLYLYINGVEIIAGEDSNITYDLTAVDPGLSDIVVKAVSGADVMYDTTYFYVLGTVTTEAVPAGMHQGINYIDDNTVTLVLYAPYKNYVFAIGEHSDWLLTDETFMKRDPDGATYWITLSGLEPGKEYPYQYFIDGNLTVADPLAEKVLDPWSDGYINEATYPGLIDYPTGKASGIVSVFQTAQPDYVWAVPDFTSPPTEKLVIYELLIRDFIAAHNYATLTDTISYLKTLGVNAIELMPIMEFEGNESWGYNPSFFIAPDKYYGTKEALKIFIDSCHANGIAVILDIAMNHAFGQCPLVQMWWDATANAPALNSPYFNQVPTHDYNVGYDFNHESDATEAFRNIVFTHWITEYHVDGYRFDLSKGYTQTNTLGNVAAWGAYDASRIAIWENIGSVIWAVNPDAKLILEHFADNSEEETLSNAGFMLWGNMNYNYNQGTMGYGGSDLNWASYQSRGWDDPHLVTYMESHDEERLMYKNLTYGNTTNPDYNVKNLNIALSREELAGAFLFTIPGPKMLWQFGELGYDYSIEYGCRVCNKPIRWDYYSNANRLRIYQVWSELIKLKTTYPAFSTTNYNMSVAGFGKRINLNDPDMNVTVLGNFDVNLANISPNFQHAGWWYEYFSGDSLNVSDVLASFTMAPGEYRLYTDVRLSTPDIIEGINHVDEMANNSIIAMPNPTEGETEILTTLQTADDVVLEFYNNTGSMIERYDLGKQAEGIFSFTWNSNAPAGIYFCRLVYGDNAGVVKISKL
ncbi:MAG TPA: alpha-amylase family glycosyl hydrolase [Chitinophagales bacterium]|nr:T9SS type A sorting domain-containing protein [Chitinophagales bacterium]HMZ89485.1 alpha-amylase family glycosyl hydrolase [Chitinophagales bacterium]HNE46603.1 alpha-amylase family glycosyl hydrolase [Chitinophagales bacterium]HNF68810.1 alpha-amylase family glycosyl hydrolase [Chitinophagales bacterium]HNI54161.1 alpha-amylase family glycosyl hydrolase [Chitinophagales bacterium]